MQDYDNLQNLFFLGPKGEQRKFFQEMIELVNNDMIFWRRNFHPKDIPPIPYNNLTSPISQSFQDHFMQSLIQLLADLKQDMPFFSPRYMAHMTGDMTLPGIIGYYAGLLYHSNNVSSEASSATLKYELSVAKQFAKLYGYDSEKSFGHITSGGTVANLESVFYFKATRFLAASMALAIKKESLPWPKFLDDNIWNLLNIPLEDLPILINNFEQHCLSHKKNYRQLLNTYSSCYLGDNVFWEEIKNTFNKNLNLPVIIVPSNAHYSWSKASHVFGLGKQHCLQVLMDRNLTMSSLHLEEVLEECHKKQKPIIQLVAVLGSTEFGTFDPLDKILQIRQRSSLYFPIHIDGAYGGYMKTMFEAGARFPQLAETAKNEYKNLDKIFSVINQSDSITVDPHKLGSTPYGAGVFLTKHGFSKDFIAEEAAYCLSDSHNQESEFPLGKYILEGSKPGASAASVYFSNKIIPLNSDGYGGLILNFSKLAKQFYQLLLDANLQNDTFSENFEICPLVPPASNVLCFFVKTKKQNKLSYLNKFNQELIYNFFPKETDHIQNFNFIISKTKLYISKLYNIEELESVKNIEMDDDSILLARLVFMNRWINQECRNDKTYMTNFLEEIKTRCLSSLKS